MCIRYWHRMEVGGGSEMPFLGIQNVPDLFGTYILKTKLRYNCNSPVEDLRIFTPIISPNLPHITCQQVMYSRAFSCELLALSCAVMPSWLTLNRHLTGLFLDVNTDDRMACLVALFSFG